MKKEKVNEFVNNLLKFEGTPYELGKANIYRSDCSGSVCAALCVTFGIAMRECADELLKKFFIKRYCAGSESIHAIFLIDNKGRAVHVAGGLYKDLYMNVSSIEKDRKGHVRSFSELTVMYSHLNFAIRELSEDELWK